MKFLSDDVRKTIAEFKENTVVRFEYSVEDKDKFFIYNEYNADTSVYLGIIDNGSDVISEVTHWGEKIKKPLNMFDITRFNPTEEVEVFNSDDTKFTVYLENNHRQEYDFEIEIYPQTAICLYNSKSSMDLYNSLTMDKETYYGRIYKKENCKNPSLLMFDFRNNSGIRMYPTRRHRMDDIEVVRVNYEHDYIPYRVTRINDVVYTYDRYGVLLTQKNKFDKIISKRVMTPHKDENDHVVYDVYTFYTMPFFELTDGMAFSSNDGTDTLLITEYLSTEYKGDEEIINTFERKMSYMPMEKAQVILDSVEDRFA